MLFSALRFLLPRPRKLTYMAISHVEIKRHCAGPRPELVEYQSPDESEDEPRPLFLAYDIYDLATSDSDPRWSQARARLNRFAEGRPIPVRKFGNRKDRDRKQPSTLAYLPPFKGKGQCAEIWEFRIQIPGFEQLRIFGRFARMDWFIAIAWRDRDQLDYTEAMSECDDTWRRLFGIKEPHKGASIDAYLSKAQPVR